MYELNVCIDAISSQQNEKTKTQTTNDRQTTELPPRLDIVSDQYVTDFDLLQKPTGTWSSFELLAAAYNKGIVSITSLNTLKDIEIILSIILFLILTNLPLQRNYTRYKKNVILYSSFISLYLHFIKTYNQ